MTEMPEPQAAADHADDPVFVEEQEHLDALYAQLIGFRDELSHQLEHEHKEAASDLVTMSEEIRPDFGGADETMETLAAIETLNSVIDAYNQYHDFSVDRLRKVLLLLRQPYFAKVRLKMRPDRPARDVYIGAAGITNDHHIPLVVDWRNPIAETYYNQENGQTSYKVNGQVKTVELELRRQFDIERDRLNNYFDTTVAIEDSLLLNALRKHHSEKLQAITATIQREQNAVVRHEDVPVMIVNGIAGSGKTSVMLQRIAFLLYQEHERLRPDQVCLFSPNEVFERYIDGVLPSMGEANPRLYTWRDFVEEQGAGNRDDGSMTDAASLDRLEAELPSLVIDQDDLRAITVDDEVLLNAGQIAAVVRKFEKFGVGPRFIALATDELHERLARRLAQMARDDAWQERMLSLDVEEQVRILGQITDTSDDEDIARATKQYVEYLFSGAAAEIDKISWLKLDRIGMRMLGVKALSASELLYLRLLICGRGASDARYVMVDEVQDYSVSQLKVLARFFSGAHFLLLGDQNQAIREGTASFDEMRAIFEASHGHVDVCRLLTSYRSSPEVTAVFSRLVHMGDDIKLASVRRAGAEPRREAFADEESFLKALRKVAEGAVAEGAEGLTAIVAHDEQAAHWLGKKLEGSVPVVRRNQALPGSGVVIVTLAMAKGLEFDHVVIPDADPATYPDTPLARRRLYTAVSRAMHQVTLFARGELSPLVA